MKINSDKKFLPLSAQTKVYACECLATAYGCLYKDGGILLWVSSIQRGRPVATDGHGLIFTSHSHQKLNVKDSRVRGRATHYGLDENRKSG